MDDALKILLLEDVAADAELILRALNRGGLQCRVKIVGNQADYRHGLEEFGPDIILSDFALPGFDGMSALRMARERLPDTPFLFVSGAIGEERAVETLNHGANDYVIKDRLQRLPVAVQKALEAERLRAATRESEQTLRESEARYRGIVESVTECIISIDERQRIVLFNAAAEKLFGYARAEIIGKPLGILVPERHRARHDEQIRAFAVDGQSSRAMGQYREIVGLRANGEEFEVRAAISQLGVSPDKRLTVILRDATELRRAEQERLDAETRYRTTLDQMLEGCQIIDFNWRYLYVNHVAARQVRRDRDELSGRTMMEMFPGTENTGAFLEFRRCMDERTAGSFQNELVYPDGTSAWFDLSVQPVAEGIFILSVDITERRRMGRALRDYAGQLRLLSRRLFEVEESERRRLARELHDRIGQNVTALSLNLNLMRGELRGELRQRIVTRLDDCEALLLSTAELVRDVLADLRPPGLDELGLVAALNEHARQVADRAGFSVTVNGAEIVPRLAPATEITLFRIVQEALMNASKHARATEVSIGLKADPDTVALIIADNGRGFDSTARLALPASSLGIVSMRERAESIGARLRVESAPGHGTRVIVESPRGDPIASGQPDLPGTGRAHDLGTWNPSRINRQGGARPGDAE